MNISFLFSKKHKIKTTRFIFKREKNIFNQNIIFSLKKVYVVLKMKNQIKSYNSLEIHKKLNRNFCCKPMVFKLFKRCAQ